MRDEAGRLVLTMKDCWAHGGENAARFAAGQTVVGVVRSVESYGVFIELAPNLAGLAEPDSTLAPGQLVSVYIKSICPQRMKVKLAVTQVMEETGLRLPLRRFFPRQPHGYMVLFHPGKLEAYGNCVCLSMDAFCSFHLRAQFFTSGPVWGTIKVKRAPLHSGRLCAQGYLKGGRQMAGNAFTAGVKPGGLNSSTEIRILLCYLIKNAASPSPVKSWKPPC